MRKRTTLTLTTVAALLSGCGTAEEQPNIIVFLVDDMGLMDTSVPMLADPLGKPAAHPLNRWYRTPNMERLASQGVRFSQFYAQSVSSPSRASLMTGQNATRHGVTNWIYSESNNRNTYGPPDWNWSGLDSSVYTLPRMLSDAGYRTIHVGKAHFGPFGSQGENPCNLGFDVNVAGCSIGEPGSYYGRDGYGLYRGTRSRAVPGLEEFFEDDVFLTDALTIMAEREMEAAIEAGEPFFLNMAHYAVHAPFMSDPRYMEHYSGDSTYSLSAKDFATLIEGMDRSLGELMDFLQEKDVAQNTLIVFLGDNGSDAPIGDERGWGPSAPLRGKKGTEFEGGMRVPMIVAWAAPDSGSRQQRRFRIPQGRTVTQVGTIMDIYPTLAAVAGAEIPETHIVDGHDLSRLIATGQDSSRDGTFLMHFPHDHRGKYFTVYREGHWKLIYYWKPEDPQKAYCVLYDLAADPYETTDVSAANQTLADSLLQRMARRLAAEGARYPVDSAGHSLHPHLPHP